MAKEQEKHHYLQRINEKNARDNLNSHANRRQKTEFELSKEKEYFHQQF